MATSWATRLVYREEAWLIPGHACRGHSCSSSPESTALPCAVPCCVLGAGCRVVHTQPEFWPAGLGGWDTNGTWASGFGPYSQWFDRAARSLNPCGTAPFLSGPGWGELASIVWRWWLWKGRRTGLPPRGCFSGSCTLLTHPCSTHPPATAHAQATSTRRTQTGSRLSCATATRAATCGRPTRTTTREFLCCCCRLAWLESRLRGA